MDRAVLIRSSSIGHGLLLCTACKTVRGGPKQEEKRNKNNNEEEEGRKEKKYFWRNI